METTHIVAKQIAVLIVADDLTGACDAGVHFAARGMRTLVSIAPQGYADYDADVFVYDTQTRCSEASMVLEQLEPVAALVREMSPAFLLKKVDSTLRGPVEREMECILKRMELSLAVLAPAFPEAGRRVRRGRVILGGDESEVDIAACFSNLQCAHVARDEISILPQRIADEMERGTRVLIVDSEDNVDLRCIAHTGRSVANVLLAGSGGLARAVAAELAGEDLVESSTGCAGGPVLICVGSNHPVTTEQLRQLEQKIPLIRVRADDEGLRTSRAALMRGGHVVLEFSREQVDSVPKVDLAAKAGVQYCASVVATGGDTATYILRSFGVQALELRDEIEPGIPWSEIRGGAAHGKVIVTKSGGFGSSDSLLKCVRFLSPSTVDQQRMEVW